jgi:hypothetical protein
MCNRNHCLKRLRNTVTNVSTDVTAGIRSGHDMDTILKRYCHAKLGDQRLYYMIWKRVTEMSMVRREGCVRICRGSASRHYIDIRLEHTQRDVVCPLMEVIFIRLLIVHEGTTASLKQLTSSVINASTVELGYNVMKATECFVSL